MTTIQFRNKGFTESKEKYFQAINHWKKRINNILDNPNNYREWLDNTDGNGEVSLNGNPIYSLINKDNSRALRIMQNEPRSKKPYMSAWIENSNISENIDIPVLAIGLELSNITEVKSLGLIEMWFREGPGSRINHAIDLVNREYEKNYEKSESERKIELYHELNELKSLKDVNFSSRVNLSNKDLDRFKTLYRIKNHIELNCIAYSSFRNDVYVIQIYTAISTLSEFINGGYKFGRGHITARYRDNFTHAFITRHKDLYGAYLLYKQLSDNIEDLSEKLGRELNIVE
jgi:hypothetical protein